MKSLPTIPAVQLLKPIYRSVEDHSDGLCRLDGKDFYRIVDLDKLAPFLMSIVSDSDLWMFLSSTGGLTAGRRNEDGALFPYETDDRLHHVNGSTGPFTLLRVKSVAADEVLWQPFARVPTAAVQRNLYKSVIGNEIIFEEVRRDLGLRFSYRWQNSDEFGFIRKCKLVSDADHSMTIEVLDGLLNVLPAGAELVIHQRASCLINAYSRCEVDPDTGLGIFAMTSLIVDKAQAAESLRANVVWSHGLSRPAVLLSTEQFDSFRAGHSVLNERLLKGKRGAYLISGELKISARKSCSWQIIADANRDQFAVELLREKIATSRNLEAELDLSAERGSAALLRNLASADALQLTGDTMASHHHMVNVLFNNMRGGVFASEGLVDSADLNAFITQRNHRVAAVHRDFIWQQPKSQPISDWIASAERRGDADLLRLVYEYLPITFSRRHGDPSRPWNRFTIAVKDDQGKPILNYEGNWRDIFQNWEAMLTSFPDYIPSVIAKFVNASTMDGFNPYRITRDGIDWEVPDPHDPWAHIGYWGDHQIVYLLRLLELSQRYHGNRLSELLGQRIYTYADVPYRLKPYQDLIRDRWNTIDFDRSLDQLIRQRAKDIGGDGKLVHESANKVLHVSLLEKLLVPMLSKLSNLVIDGGIWMNTQRPEWNDANNALVGNGISVVTMCHLRRYVAFLLKLLAERDFESIAISTEVVVWVEGVTEILIQHADLLDRPQVSDSARRQVLDELGELFGTYRLAVYSNGFRGSSAIDMRRLDQLLAVSLRYLDHGILANRRDDGLFHSYNLVRFNTEEKTLGITRLPEMLEGQVAVLSSGALSSSDCADLVQTLFASRLYRPDQQSFMLYPNCERPGFLLQNRIPSAKARTNPLLNQMLAAGDRSIVAIDAAAHCRFTGSPPNAGALSEALDRAGHDPRWTDLVKIHRQSVLNIFESVFTHASFTGRSGTMYGYEGQGCVYWHMVSKLLLATQECCLDAHRNQAPPTIQQSLATLYYQVRAGLSFNKSPETYGAIPLDPYSHTPGHAGVQQPGMTGQVKEEIITRLGEIGVAVQRGCLTFDPFLLRGTEFLSVSTAWTYLDGKGRPQTIKLPAKSLAFTVCQTPVVYHLTEAVNQIELRRDDGQVETVEGSTLPRASSQQILTRSGKVMSVIVSIRPTTLCRA